MLITDGKMKPRMLRGGYSLKIYDSEWMRITKETLEESLDGGILVGDSHFYSARKYFSNITIHAPILTIRHAPQEGETHGHLTQEEEKYNSQVRKIRHRIESPFGLAKKKFQALSVPWMEDTASLESLVFFTIGLLAKLKR